MQRWLNFRLAAIGAVMLLLAAFHSTRVSAGQRDNLQLLFNTNLKVEMPSGWALARTYPLSALSSGPPQLEHIGKPVYQLTISQTMSRTEQHSCINLVGFLNALPRLGSTISPPAFIPDVYFGSILEIPEIQVTCLDAGDGEVAVTIRLPADGQRFMVLNNEGPRNRRL